MNVVVMIAGWGMQASTSCVQATIQESFVSLTTVHFIQEDCTRARHSTIDHLCPLSVKPTQLDTNNPGTDVVEAIFTDGAPGLIDTEFHSSLSCPSHLTVYSYNPDVTSGAVGKIRQ